MSMKRYGILAGLGMIGGLTALGVTKLLKKNKTSSTEEKEVEVKTSHVEKEIKKERLEFTFPENIFVIIDVNKTTITKNGVIMETNGESLEKIYHKGVLVKEQPWDGNAYKDYKSIVFGEQELDIPEIDLPPEISIQQVEDSCVVILEDYPLMAQRCPSVLERFKKEVLPHPEKHQKMKEFLDISEKELFQAGSPKRQQIYKQAILMREKKWRETKYSSQHLFQ